MTTSQVANMFGEAKREDATSIFRKNMQNGMFNKADTRAIQKKSTKFNLSQVMRPDQWKNVTKSPAALKCKYNLIINLAFRNDLKEFRSEMNAKNQSYYIPVTMDELMARFLTNFERNKCKSKFKIDK